MLHRPAIERLPESRAFVDRALAELRGAYWRPGAWAVFLWRCGARSADQARRHPLAAVEVTALHLALIAPSGWSWLWLTASWTMAIAHLGLLGPERRSIGPANVLSLVRANLPPGRWSPLVAIATDAADGWLARRSRPTAFGAYADGLADVAFWTRQVWAREPSRILRTAAAAAWLLPLAAIGTAYFTAGRTIDYPRPLLVRRLSAGLQFLLAARALAGRLEE
jgi:phosphatidylglycerophosphate synthase